jgi:pyruvate ferredoxin oxidoreductase delta subunit
MKKQDNEHFSSTIPITNNFYSNEDWRFEQPVWDTEKCVRCGICNLFCPDSAIFQNDAGYYEVDLTFCKGCGICSRQCPKSCISMEQTSQKPPWVALVDKIISAGENT